MKKDEVGISFEKAGIADALYRWELKVPLNQRPYAWEEGNIEKLFHDLTQAYDNQPIYFLGTVMFTQGDAGTTEVADGQQRLATISVLIAAIRDYLIELGDDKGATTYQSDFLIKYDPPSGLYKARLSLNVQDDQIFYQRILLPPAERKDIPQGPFSSHELLLNAQRLAAEHVRNVTSGLDKTAKTKKLHRWVTFLKDQAIIIVVTVPSHIGNSFKMFETLNARGAPASQVDILKNFIFEKAPKHASEIQSHWISMLSVIELHGGDDLVLTYIRHLWVSLHGPTTNDELGKSIENKIKNEGDALDLVSTLDSASGDYSAILTPLQSTRWEGLSTEARRAIDLITNDLGAEQIRPLVLAAARKFDKGELQKALQLFLSWSVRFLISGGGGGGKLDRYYGLQAKEVSDGKIKTAAALAKAMEDVVPTDAKFEEAFARASVSKGSLARYYLRSIELHRANDPHPQFLINEDPNAVNLEHVLPITPGPDWKVPADTAAVYYKRLGNMALLPAKTNVKIGNESFKTKRDVFKKNALSITKEIASYSVWGPTQITKRQSLLASVAPKIWPLIWK